MTSGMTLVRAGHMDFWYRMVELCFYLNVILPIAGTRWSGQENWRRDLLAPHVNQEDKHLRISLISDTTTHSETKFEFGPHCMHTVTLLHVVSQEPRDLEIPLSTGHTVWNMGLPLVTAEEGKLAGTGSCSIFSLFLWDVTHWSHGCTKLKELRVATVFIYFLTHFQISSWNHHEIKFEKRCKESQPLWTFLLL